MKELNTIQRSDKLNTVHVADVIGPGHGHHYYEIHRADVPDSSTLTKLLEIQFQEGPRKDPSSIHGVLDSDLLEIVRDRLESFQEGEYATPENEHALRHVTEALMWMNKRAMDRAARGVLGTNQV